MVAGSLKVTCWHSKEAGMVFFLLFFNLGSKVGAVLDTKNKVKDKANAVKENIKDMPTQTAYAVYSAKEKAKPSVSDFKRGMVQEQQSRQTGRLEKQTQHRQNIADKRMELQKAQEARQAQRKDTHTSRLCLMKNCLAPAVTRCLMRWRRMALVHGSTSIR